MAGYISREATIKDFERHNFVNPRWTPQRVKQLLCRRPNADVEPVRHGHWIESGDYVEAQGSKLPIKMCSACCMDIILEDFQNYCPNCGTKMDLEEDKSND